MTKKNYKVHQINASKGQRLEKQPTRMERLEGAVRRLAGLPDFLLQRFQVVLKTVEDLRFTYEVVGQILQEKGIITQEELTAKGNAIIEERKKEREAKLEQLKQSKEQGLEVVNAEKSIVDTENDELKSEVAEELMQPDKELQETQIQTEDVSIKEI